MTLKTYMLYGHGIQEWGNIMKLTKKALKQLIKEELTTGPDIEPEVLKEYDVQSRPVHDPRVLAELQTQTRELQAHTILLQNILAAVGGAGGTTRRPRPAGVIGSALEGL